jgi:hypothetical protein
MVQGLGKNCLAWYPGGQVSRTPPAIRWEAPHIAIPRGGPGGLHLGCGSPAPGQAGRLPAVRRAARSSFRPMWPARNIDRPGAPVGTPDNRHPPTGSGVRPVAFLSRAILAAPISWEVPHRHDLDARCGVGCTLEDGDGVSRNSRSYGAAGGGSMGVKALKPLRRDGLA